MQTKDAIKHFGSKAKIAESLEISRGAVTRWEDVVPLARALQLHKMTKKRIPLRLGDYE